MTREDIIRMAKSVGIDDESWQTVQALRGFADLVAAAEREACAKVCENEIEKAKPAYSVTAENALKAIRARGENGSLVVHPSDDDWYYANKLKANND